jgi:hypothetical protein
MVDARKEEMRDQKARSKARKPPTILGMAWRYIRARLPFGDPPAVEMPLIPEPEKTVKRKYPQNFPSFMRDQIESR